MKANAEKYYCLYRSATHIQPYRRLGRTISHPPPRTIDSRRVANNNSTGPFSISKQTRKFRAHLFLGWYTNNIMLKLSTHHSVRDGDSWYIRDHCQILPSTVVTTRLSKSFLDGLLDFWLIILETLAAVNEATS